MPRKLTEAQRRLLRRANPDHNGVRVFSRREDNTAWRLVDRGLLNVSNPAYGSDFRITPAGRLALAAAKEQGR